MAENKSIFIDDVESITTSESGIVGTRSEFFGRIITITRQNGDKVTLWLDSDDPGHLLIQPE